MAPTKSYPSFEPSVPSTGQVRGVHTIFIYFLFYFFSFFFHTIFIEQINAPHSKGLPKTS